MKHIEEGYDIPRLEVALFTKEMERVLKCNDYKGGWQSCDVEFFVEKIDEEKAEVVIALSTVLKDSSVENKLALLRECADLANIAMMVADVYGGLNDPEPEREEGGEKKRCYTCRLNEDCYTRITRGTPPDYKCWEANDDC